MTTAAAATNAATATSAAHTNGSSQSHDKRYCEACRREITVKGYENHCKTRRHRERAKGIKRSRPWLTANPDKTYNDYKISQLWCDICKKNVRLTHKEVHKRKTPTKATCLIVPLPAQNFKNVYMPYTVRINHPTNVDAQFAYDKPYIIDKLTNAHLVDDAIKLQLQWRALSTSHTIKGKNHQAISKRKLQK